MPEREGLIITAADVVLILFFLFQQWGFPRQNPWAVAIKAVSGVLSIAAHIFFLSLSKIHCGEGTLTPRPPNFFYIFPLLFLRQSQWSIGARIPKTAPVLNVRRWTRPKRTPGTIRILLTCMRTSRALTARWIRTRLSPKSRDTKRLPLRRRRSRMEISILSTTNRSLASTFQSCRLVAISPSMRRGSFSPHAF